MLFLVDVFVVKIHIICSTFFLYIQIVKLNTTFCEKAVLIYQHFFSHLIHR